MPTRVVMVTHDSWALPKRLLRAFETASGYQLVVRTSGDAGALTNKLVLTQGAPLGDVAFGVDNTFASRALDADVFDPAEIELPAGAERLALPDGADRLVPVDSGNVCVNIDTGWFAGHDLRPPRTLDDLADPAYRGLFVAPAASTSSPGMAFLLATIAAYGDAWPDYWTSLMANDTAITAGWSDAYFVDFTQGGENGDRPIVVSYDSSPAFTIGKDGRSTTRALLDTCFQQVEYAGVLAGAANPEGARAVLSFLLSPEVQAALPESMYVFPVREGTALPTEWARFAKRPSAPATLDPADIAAHRDEWLTTWTDVTSR
ncbi:MAG: thiamine ABC transporter substrate-binding protein [Nocardioides sp.]